MEGEFTHSPAPPIREGRVKQGCVWVCRAGGGRQGRWKDQLGSLLKKDQNWAQGNGEEGSDVRDMLVVTEL